MRKLPSMRLRFAAAAVVLGAFAIPAFAHHTVAGIYDPDKRATLSGVIDDVQWKQPHVLVHLNVKGEDGQRVAWEVETQAPIVMQSHGLRREMLRPGTSISSTVCLARDGSHRGYAQNIVVPDQGTIVSFGCNSTRSTP